jgi:hypothetical protein
MPVSVNRSLRLPDGEYFPERQRKSGIAIHHTVCRAAKTAIDWWKSDKAPDGGVVHVATAYLIDRDGTVLEIFDPSAWAYQFGLPWPDGERVRFEQRFIGIELASDGGLTEHEGLLYALDKISAATLRPRSQAFDSGISYRGYRWFDRYQEPQLVALARLVEQLCTRFSIPRVYPSRPYDYYGKALAAFKGVIGHAMVRADKSDPAPDPRLWQTLRDVAACRPTPVPPPSAPAAAARQLPPLTQEEIEALFTHNARRLDLMSTGAGSLIATLVHELERRKTYLEFLTPEPGQYAIEYEVAQGNGQEVSKVARALGFKRVTDRVLEVRHG